MENCLKFNKRRAFNSAVGPGKNTKLINVGPTFILDYRIPSNMIFFSFALLPRNNSCHIRSRHCTHDMMG